MDRDGAELRGLVQGGMCGARWTKPKGRARASADEEACAIASSRAVDAGGHAILLDAGLPDYGGMRNGSDLPLLLVLQRGKGLPQVRDLEDLHQLLFLRNFGIRLRVPHVLPLQILQVARRRIIPWKDGGFFLHAGVWRIPHACGGPICKCALLGILSDFHDGVCMGQEKSLREHELLRTLQLHCTLLTMGAPCILDAAGIKPHNRSAGNGSRSHLLLSGGCLSQHDGSKIPAHPSSDQSHVSRR